MLEGNEEARRGHRVEEQVVIECSRHKKKNKRRQCPQTGDTAVTPLSE